jgi:hypothetical protein
MTISDNYLDEGERTISNGVAFTAVSGLGGNGVNFTLTIKNNTIKRFPGNGIVADQNMLINSIIFGNEVEDNGLDGIYINGGLNRGVFLFDNESEMNYRFDCHDDTTGSGTANTGDYWSHNAGNLSQPSGLCTSGRRHDDDWR